MMKALFRMACAWTVLLLVASAPLCAATKKKQQTEKAPAAATTEKSSASSASGGVSIPIPQSANRSQSYLSSINKRIITLIEDGSPRSLKLAASLLHRSIAENYSASEKSMLVVCAMVTELVWPSSAVTWEVPAVDYSDPYTGALNSAKHGLFDEKTGNGDFLALVLPTVLLVTDAVDESYFAKAESALTQALSLREDSTLANYLMGVLRMRQKNYAQARRFFQRVLAANEGNREALLAQERLYALQRDYENVLKVGAQLLAADPQDVETLRLCCDAYYALRQFDKAEEYAARVLMVRPDDYEYILVRAKIFISRADYVKTSSLLDAYAHSGSRSRDYFILRARLQREWNKNNAAACATMEQALTLYPNDTQIVLYAAQTASAANAVIGGYTALALAQKVLKKDAANAEAITICITELDKKGGYAEAYALSSDFIKRPSVDKEMLRRHVDICLALHKTDEVWNLAKSLYGESPNSQEVQKTYIKVLIATERRAEALRLISSLLDGADSKMKSFLYYEQSFLYGDEATVLENLRSSLTANPRNSDALYRLYQVYYNKKDWRRAQYYLKQVVALNPNDGNAIAKNTELNALLQK